MKYFRNIVLVFVVVFVVEGCHMRVGPTNLHIVDPVRHYLPLVQGEDLKMHYTVVNVGRNPLIIQDIQPASLSIEVVKDPPKMVPAGDSLDICLVFHTDRNIGYSEHLIRIFGNIKHVNDSATNGLAILTFDTHIVRPTVDQSDYEERYWTKKAADEKLVDGTRGEQGYYTDEDILENQLNENYEFYPNSNRDQQVQRTLEKMQFKR